MLRECTYMHTAILCTLVHITRVLAGGTEYVMVLRQDDSMAADAQDVTSPGRRRWPAPTDRGQHPRNGSLRARRRVSPLIRSTTYARRNAAAGL